MRALVFLLPGALFGVGLVVSGMSNPAKVHDFLDVAGGRWDPSLAFVMVGAIGVFATLNLLVHRRPRALSGQPLPGPRSRGSVQRRTVLGAVLFGVGWGLSGICPGPAISAIGTLRVEVFVFLGTMLLGMVVAQRVFGMDTPG